VIEQPDDCRVLLPAWMTESFAATLPMVAVPRLSLDSLRELRDIIDTQRLPSSPSSGTTSDHSHVTTEAVAFVRSPVRSPMALEHTISPDFF
jgi:hypothetical protein